MSSADMTLAAYVPTDLSSAKDIALTYANSGLLADLKSPEQVFAVMGAGAELGLRPWASLRSIYMVKGKVTLSAAMMVAIVRASPLCLKWRLVESTDKVATYETIRVGDDAPTAMSFTIEQAKRAKLDSGTWLTYTESMLRARCKANLCREVYPDLLAGVYATGEMEQDPRDEYTGTVEPSRPEPARSPAAEPDVQDAEYEPVEQPAQPSPFDELASALLGVEMSPDDFIAYCASTKASDPRAWGPDRLSAVAGQIAAPGSQASSDLREWRDMRADMLKRAVNVDKAPADAVQGIADFIMRETHEAGRDADAAWAWWEQAGRDMYFAQGGAS
jgi:hypothetical protein